jgi:hypothetical protein
MGHRRYADTLPLVLAILTAAVLQGALIARAPTISADGIIFTTIARDLSQHPVEAFRHHDQHPGYPAAMLAATRFAQSLGYRDEPAAWMIGGRAVSFVCGLLAVWIVWLFARDLYDRQVANIAALVFAILPLARMYAADAQSDMPHALFYLIAAWLASSAIASGRLLPLAGAGAASAVAYWIRPEGLEVFVVAMLFVLGRGLRGDVAWRRVGVAAGTLAAATLLVALPYPMLAGKITSKQLPFVKDQAAPTFIAQVAEVKTDRSEHHAPPASSDVVQEMPAASRPVASASAELAESTPSPPQIAQVVPKRAMAPPAASRATSPARQYRVGLVLSLAAAGTASLVECFCQGFRYVFMPLYLLGQWEMVRRRTPSRLVAFLWVLAGLHMAILLWVFFVSGYIASRHVLPLIALAMPFTALGILGVADWLAARFHVMPSRAALAILGVCTLVVLPYSVRAYNREFVPVIEATRWVQARAAPGSGIVCNSPYVGYYGKLPTAHLGPDAISLDAALAQGIPGVRYDYVVLHVNAHGYRPEWVAQIERRYRQVRQYDDPTPHRLPRKVLVFQAIESHARQPARDRSS